MTSALLLLYHHIFFFIETQVYVLAWCIWWYHLPVEAPWVERRWFFVEGPATKTIAVLAGDGIGPEVMAETVKARWMVHKSCQIQLASCCMKIQVSFYIVFHTHSPENIFFPFPSIKRPAEGQNHPPFAWVLRSYKKLESSSGTPSPSKTTRWLGETPNFSTMHPGYAGVVSLILRWFWWPYLLKISWGFLEKSSLTSWILVELTRWFGLLKLLQHFPLLEQSNNMLHEKHTTSKL